MAKSPSHKFGQIIGNLLEEIIYPVLKDFSDKYGYYVDKSGTRGKARSGKKVKWQDKFGNEHDLDFVIEDGGTKDIKGRPLAFIEAAWRRYTRHSRNKAQEIQSAVLPIAEHHSWDAPFLGAVIAGFFTEGSINQLRSVGFNVLHIPYETIISAFASVNIDARFDDTSPDEEFQACVDQIEALNSRKRQIIKSKLKEFNQKEIIYFIEKLRKSLTRTIRKILVCPLFGSSNEFSSIDEAISFLNGSYPAPTHSDFRKIEVIVVYSNGDRIEGSFEKSSKAIDFLQYAKKET